MKLRPLGLIAIAFAALTCSGGDVLFGPEPSGDGGGGSNMDAATTNATVATTTTTGSNCSEMPCKLTTPQCGCDDGDKCSMQSDGSIICATNGSVGLGEVCTPDDCVAGAHCMRSDDGLRLCKAYCDDDTDCEAPGGRCLLRIVDAVAQKACTINCDLLDSAGCDGAGTKCALAGGDVLATDCATAGHGAAFQTCGTEDDCVAGTTCVNTSGMSPVCLPWCVVGGAPCTVGTCVALTVAMGTPIVIGNVQYGACLQ